MNIAINFGLYQLCWFACILGGANALPWLGVILMAVAVVYHLHSANEPLAELKLMLIAGLLGAVWDSGLVAAGWLVYPSGTLIEGTAPYWIFALWIGFATNLNVTLRWLRGRPALASALGAAAGPIAYLGGEKLGGLTFEDTFAGLSALAIGWAVIMPLLVAVATRHDGFRGRDANVQIAHGSPQLSTEHV
ncbi:MAG: DUF2878 domain-containing protein [Gammaproteobacteria bacterium]|nr:DUF2878 domain-containing protein [Gammaproteobacteria bacterium]